MNRALAPLEISTDRSRLDIAMIHKFLSGSYWAEGRSRAQVERSIANSVCFGGYLAAQQIAFGRVITDTVTAAMLVDVFVLPDWRGRGHGASLVTAMLEYIDSTDATNASLRTRDAHGLYERFGFSVITESSDMMRRHRFTTV